MPKSTFYTLAYTYVCILKYERYLLALSLFITCIPFILWNSHFIIHNYSLITIQFRIDNHCTGDIVCNLTTRVIGPYAPVPDFIPTVHRYVRFNVERQRDTIHRILTMIIYTNKDSHQVSCITAELDILCQVVCNAWAFLKPDRATARRLVFFTVTCVFFMRSGIQPYHIFPKIMEFAAFNKPAVIDTLRDIKGPYYIRFSPKTMSDYNTATLYQMRYIYIHLNDYNL